MKKAFKAALGLLAITFSGAAFSYSHVVWLATIDGSDFQKFSSQIYIDPALDESEHAHVLSMINKGKERIQQVFGAYTANPTIVITGTPENAQKYGLRGVPGTAFAAPWNEYLVVDYQTEDIDVIAHELMHAQMRETLGYWGYQTSIPTWFDEGVAMQVDFRPHYNIPSGSYSEHDINRVKTLGSRSEFWSNNREQNIENYRTAKAAVHQILEKHPPNTLYSMLLKIREGENFENLFGE